MTSKSWLTFGKKRVRNLLSLSGDRARKKAPAPCGCGCNQTFLLYPWQDIPKHERPRGVTAPAAEARAEPRTCRSCKTPDAVVYWGNAPTSDKTLVCCTCGVERDASEAEIEAVKAAGG